MEGSGREENDGLRFVEAFRRNAEKLARDGLYDPRDEHDSCGVGLVAAIDGKPRREVVTDSFLCIESAHGMNRKENGWDGSASAGSSTN